jgi:SagB-type dehydrogenase family enzyme
MIKKRRTIRRFDKHKPMSFRTLSGLLYASYGVSTVAKIESGRVLKRVVPSAGALYPLHIYCVVLKKIEKLSPGVYYFKKKSFKPFIIRLSKILGRDQLMKFLPGSESMLKRASLLLIIVCNFKRITQKYANRGYLYGLLEAGHVAQNIYLYCAEQNLAVVEIGGFDDIELSKFLQLKYPEVSPLVCFLIGPSLDKRFFKII